MTELNQLLQQLEIQINNHEKLNPAISQSSIGWHIDHSLLVINGIVKQLQNSNPTDYNYRFNYLRTYIKLLNKIPRGKGKAPKVVQPTETPSIEMLTLKLLDAKNTILELENLHPNSYFAHPYFGNLNVKTTLWFLKLHTKHHLKIIEDIGKI